MLIFFQFGVWDASTYEFSFDSEFGKWGVGIQKWGVWNGVHVVCLHFFRFGVWEMGCGDSIVG